MIRITRTEALNAYLQNKKVYIKKYTKKNIEQISQLVDQKSILMSYFNSATLPSATTCRVEYWA